VNENTTDKGVKVALEKPDVKKEDIKVSAYGEAVEVTANNPQRNYHKTIDLPKEANTETSKSSYHKETLEITFSKWEIAQPKGKRMMVEWGIGKLNNIPLLLTTRFPFVGYTFGTFFYLTKLYPFFSCYNQFPSRS